MRSYYKSWLERHPEWDKSKHPHGEEDPKNPNMKTSRDQYPDLANAEHPGAPLNLVKVDKNASQEQFKDAGDGDTAAEEEENQEDASEEDTTDAEAEDSSEGEEDAEGEEGVQCDALSVYSTAGVRIDDGLQCCMCAANAVRERHANQHPGVVHAQ